MRNIYCVVGPSGCGKTTVVEALREKYGYQVVESYTTRPPRYPGETGHIFVSPEEFQALGKMCAYTKFDGHEYGVTPDLIEQNDLYVIDPAGVEFLRNEYHGSKEIQIIGLTAAPDVLHRRMKKRGDSEDKISRRLANDSVAFRSLNDLSDILISSEGPVGPICECIHEFIGVKERQSAWKHEFSLRDAHGKVISSGKRFYDMEDALEALREVYPDGLPDGWYVVDETNALKESYIKAIKQCNPSFKVSAILVDMVHASATSADGGYLAVPFEYHGKSYIYREHLCEGWIEPRNELGKNQAVDKLIEDATARSESLEKVRDLAKEELGHEISSYG